MVHEIGKGCRKHEFGVSLIARSPSLGPRGGVHAPSGVMLRRLHSRAGLAGFRAPGEMLRGQVILLFLLGVLLPLPDDD